MSQRHRKAMKNLHNISKSKNITLLTKIHIVKAVVLEKTLESPLDCKEIKPFSPKGNQF